MSSNQRKDLRRDLKWDGMIVNIDDSVIGQCRTQNVSATGAKITMVKPVEVPDEFALMLTQNGTVKRRCKVVWRVGDDIGVTFVMAK